jgi:hypothetical protein
MDPLPLVLGSSLLARAAHPFRLLLAAVRGAMTRWEQPAAPLAFRRCIAALLRPLREERSIMADL